MIDATTGDDSLIADFFCGCGTTIEVAEKMGKNWIGNDIYKGAVEVMRKRIEDNYNMRVEIINTMSNSVEELNSLNWMEYQIRTIELLGGQPNFDKGKDGGS